MDRLLPTGFLMFHRRALAKVGVVTVAKKEGSQRLVFDCRVSNALYRKAPHTELATANALCNVDLSDEAFGQTAANAGDSAAISFAAADLIDGFYQFALDDRRCLALLPGHLLQGERGGRERGPQRGDGRDGGGPPPLEGACGWHSECCPWRGHGPYGSVRIA